MGSTQSYVHTHTLPNTLTNQINTLRRTDGSKPAFLNEDCPQKTDIIIQSDDIFSSFIAILSQDFIMLATGKNGKLTKG